MKIEQNAVVTVSYNLETSESGQEKVFLEKTSAETPFVFLFGNGGLIQGFETQIAGMSAGDKFAFDIDPANGYGTFDLNAIVPVPKEAFNGPDGTIDLSVIQVGKMLPMMDNEGHHLQGKVLEITDSAVKMDFNHPLAGKNLHFSGEVISIRQATEDEIAHGHVHDGTHGH